MTPKLDLLFNTTGVPKTWELSDDFDIVFVVN